MIGQIQPDQLRHPGQGGIIHVLISFLRTLRERHTQILHTALRQRGKAVDFRPIAQLQKTQIFHLLQRFQRTDPGHVQSQDPQVSSGQLGQIDLTAGNPQHLQRLHLRQRRKVGDIGIRPDPVTAILQLYHGIQLCKGRECAALHTGHTQKHQIFAFFQTCQICNGWGSPSIIDRQYLQAVKMPQICQRGHRIIRSLYADCAGCQLLIAVDVSSNVHPIRCIFDDEIPYAGSGIYRDSLIIPDIAVIDISLRAVKPFPDVLLHHRVLPLNDIVLPMLGVTGRNRKCCLLNENILHFRTERPRSQIQRACTCAEQKHCTDRQAQNF